MSSTNTETLRKKKCLPCEGGVPAITAQEAPQYMEATPKWELAEDSKSISRTFHCNNFVEGMALMNQIGDVAESEQHHPDLHLTGYRKLKVVLTTHAIDGLSENDFIVAAKIDEIVD